MRLMLRDLYDVILDALSSGKKIKIKPSGKSMFPLLRDKEDEVIIESLNEDIKKNDIVLYKRANGNFALHRVLKVRDDGFIIRGDNNWNKEYGVKREEIIGVVKEIKRKDNYIKMTDLRYMLYLKFWRAILLFKEIYRTMRLIYVYAFR